jgi:hypothetical protein
VIAFQNRSSIYRTLLEKFQSRSCVRSINRKTGTRRTPPSDVNTNRIFSQTLIKNHQQINRTQLKKFQPTPPPPLKKF